MLLFIPLSKKKKKFLKQIVALLTGFVYTSYPDLRNQVSCLQKADTNHDTFVH